MSAMTLSEHDRRFAARVEGTFSRAKRQQIHQGHLLVNAAPISQEAKHLGHLIVDRIVALNYPHIGASCKTLAKWLEEAYAIGGCRYRIGRRGPARCGPKRETLSESTINRYVIELLRVGLLEQIGGGRAVGRRYAGKPARGLQRWLKPSGLLWDVLRGAYKPWRDEFSRGATPVQGSLELPSVVAAVRSSPLPVSNSSHLTSTPLPSEEILKVSALRTGPLVVPTSPDALAPPRTIEKRHGPRSVIYSDPETPSDDEHAMRLRRMQAIAVDPPAPDPDSRE
jgi:hypothetical protein